MKRREFINTGLVSVATGLVAPKLALAGDNQQTMAGGVFFTKKNPGRWGEKVASHLPNVETESAREKVIVKVTTAHGMDGYNHYIVKHVLLDQKYNYLDEKIFNPMKDKVPESTFTLENYKGYIHVLSMCNQHDVWLKGVKI